MSMHKMVKNISAKMIVSREINAFIIGRKESKQLRGQGGECKDKASVTGTGERQNCIDNEENGHQKLNAMPIL